MEDQISNKTTFKYKLELFNTSEKIWSLTFFLLSIYHIAIVLNQFVYGIKEMLLALCAVLFLFF